MMQIEYFGHRAAPRRMTSISDKCIVSSLGEPIISELFCIGENWTFHFAVENKNIVEFS